MGLLVEIIMKKILVCMVLICASVSTFAKESVNETLEADEKGYVKIEHLNGSAKIHAWDKAEVKVQGTLGENTQDFIFERNGNHIFIKVEVKSSKGWNVWRSKQGDKLDIFVPEFSQINYSSVNADINIDGVKGGTSIETVNGDVRANSLAGRIRLESVNGDVDAEQLDGSVKIETVNGNIFSKNSKGKKDRYESVNGDIEVNSVSSEINIETVNGDLKLHLGQVEQLNLGTVNGDIEVELELVAGGEVDANSIGGAINLSFQEQVSANFDIEAHAGGHISNDLTDHKMQKAKYGPRRWLEFSKNGGNAKVDVSTVSGRIELEKR
jgi:DUF4097 and DUF4098 domain-containing protein YvlB